MRPSRRNGKLCLAVLASALLFSGCMKIGPEYVRPQTALSPNWLASGDKRVDTAPAQYRAWWKAFNDPVLDRVIDRAYKENLSLKLAGVRVLEARARLGATVGELFPQTQEANGSISVNHYNTIQSFGLPATTFWEAQVGLGFNWEIDFWGKFRRAIESADANLLGAVSNYDAVLVSLTADAASSYVQIRTLLERLRIARENVDAQLEIFKLTETRFKGGAATERDVEQARALLLGTEATIPTLEAQLRQAKDALCVLMGIPPDDLADILQGASDIPAPPPTVAIGIPADLLRRRPDVRSAELQAIAQSAQIGIAKADFLPAFSLTGSFGFLSADAGGASLVDLFSYKSRTGSFGPAIQWKILDYGRTANNVRVQDALLQELLISYKNTVLKAQQEVEDALAGFLRSGENAELLSQSAAAAKKSLDLAVVQYERGSIDFTTVLLSQQLLLTAQDGLALSLGNIAGNLIGVYRALGGGWEIREGQDLVAPETREAMEKRTNWGKLLSPTVYMPPDAGAQPTIRRPDW